MPLGDDPDRDTDSLDDDAEPTSPKKAVHPSMNSRNAGIRPDSVRQSAEEVAAPAQSLLPSAGSGAPPPDRTIGSTISIGDFFSLLRRRLVTIFVCFVICIVAALALLEVASKTYESQSVVKVAPVTAAGDTGAAKDINTITEARVVAGTAVAERAAELIGYHGSLDSLLGRVTVTSPLNSQLLYISYSAGTGRAAAAGANAFANAYLAYRKSVGDANLDDQSKTLASKISGLQSQLAKLPKTAPASESAALQSQIQSLTSRLYGASTTVVVPGQVVSTAQVPSAPSSPKKTLYLGGGTLAGLILGIIAAIVRDRRDDTLHGTGDLEHSLGGAPVLGTVAARRASSEARAGLDEPERRPDADAFRTIATKLRAPMLSSESKSLLIVSSGTATEENAPVNIATMLAGQGVQTVLITTSQGAERTTQLFEDEKVPQNLDDGLTPAASVANLWLLSLGDETDMDSTISVQRPTIDEMINLVDIALIDAVNVNRASSVLSLGQLTPSALLVGLDRQTTHAQIRHAVRELGQIGTVPVGGILYVRRRHGLDRLWKRSPS